MLPHDFDLTTAHLQALAGREAIVALFAQLGYNTEARLKQTAAALGFSDVLAHEVTHVERVADHENGELQVYLLEMKRVTVALTQALARALRNRAGNFLLVLTADYERIDFVLMDLVRPEGSGSGIGLKAAFLRPRTLTLERRNPSPVEVRVLRRFSYTESDVYYQLDKIRSAYGVAEWSEPFFNNRALFSDYYLNERLPQLPEWQAEAAPAFRALSKLLADAREKFAGKREAELRTLLYQPLFAALGWQVINEYETDKRITAQTDEIGRADYVLSDASGARVPCLTYVWDRYLDGPDETRDNETPRENPAQTVVGLLDHDRDGGWAIVTNGKVWRLYSARAHSRATNYYEIDLEETLASPEADTAFKYFWLFFRGTTPTPNPSPADDKTVGRRGEKFLDFLLDESASFAKALGERLKDRVFGEVFPYFAEGFIRHGHERPSTAPRTHPERNEMESKGARGSAQDATQHFWRYYDLQTQQILDNRFLIASLIACAPDTPRVIGEADVFAIQAKVQQHILDSVQAQAAAEAAPTIVEPIQQTVAAVLREHLNNPTLNRSEVRAVLRALSLPMTRVDLNRLKAAYQAYQTNEDAKQLLQALRGALRETEPSPAQRPLSTPTLTVDDLQLVCWEYVWS